MLHSLRKSLAVLPVALMLLASWVAVPAAHGQQPPAKPAPAPQTPAQRGQYLAQAGDCIPCHTANGGTPFAGGYRIDTPFGGLLAPNITPDPKTGIGLWSADQFYRALHSSVARHHQDMSPALPFDF